MIACVYAKKIIIMYRISAQLIIKILFIRSLIILDPKIPDRDNKTNRLGKLGILEVNFCPYIPFKHK